MVTSTGLPPDDPSRLPIDPTLLHNVPFIPDASEVEVEGDIKRDGIPELDIEVTAKDMRGETTEAYNENRGDSQPMINLRYSFKVVWPQRLPLRYVRRQFADLEQAFLDAGVTFPTGVHVYIITIPFKITR